MSRLPRDPVIFGTVEISDPRFEGEGLRDMTVRSPALGRRADLTVWLSEPATHPGSRVIVLLHGCAVYLTRWRKRSFLTSGVLIFQTQPSMK